MGLSAATYAEMLGQLLPPGPAWPLEDSQNSRLTEAWAQEFARLDARADALVEEADPRTALEMLPDWERVAGLPDVCAETGVTLTIGQRRALLLAKLVSQGGQSPQYYVDVAAALGFAITITEFRPWHCGSACGTPLYNDAWAYTWQVNAPAVTARHWACGDACGEPLQTWGNYLLECVLNRIKPAHTVLLFSYG